MSRLRSVILLFFFAALGLALSRPAEDYRHFALIHEGDLQRGKALFLDPQKVACSRCHSVDGSASKAGPDLFAIGDKFGRGDLIDAVLKPSASIAVGYNTTTVITRSEEEVSGIIKQATPDGIELMGADAKLVRVKTADIATQTTSEISLMPEGLQEGLTLQEFTDLIEYLVSLKQPESAVMIAHGMPSQIEELGHPVTFQPFPDDDSHFEHPVWLGPVPGEHGVFLVVEHETGKIWRLDTTSPAAAKTLFVDLGRYITGTRGLIGIALHPEFHQNRKYYYAKHLVENGKFATHIMERQAAPDLKSDSGNPSRQIIKMDATTGVHYGGGLQFGPDGYFYIGMGDTGPQEDPQGHGQNTMLFLGKMLRIDVNHEDAGRAYSIPHDNPFIAHDGVRPEIWALGFREPWRFSFDSLTGDLWVGDVGQDRYEEVDLVKPGQNYGWNVYEGFERFSNRYRREGEVYVPPVFAYGRKFGVSVTGGFVCRQDPKSSFYGVYVFGDYQSQRLWGLTRENGALKQIRQIGMAPQRIVAFGSGDQGELYLVGYEGRLYRIHFESATFE